MAKKELKLNIKNSQIAAALQLGKLKEKLAQKKADGPQAKEKKPAKEKSEPQPETEAVVAETESPRRKARTRSAFAEQKEEAESAVPEVKKKEEVVEKKEAIPEEQPIKAEEKPVQAVPSQETVPPKQKHEQLGPTGRHIKDLLPKKKPQEQTPSSPKPKEAPSTAPQKKQWDKGPASKPKEFKDLKPNKKPGSKFNTRGRSGLYGDDDTRWRKRKHKSHRTNYEETVVRPSKLHVRLPITIKELAREMKLKASDLIQKLFLQGIVCTINDILEDVTTIQLLGMEFGCTITIDTSEEERIRITDKTIKEEVLESSEADLELRAPIVTFMGHVDHGKTSLIDTIRKTDTATGEAGAITQHIGAFKCKTAVGEITILDTPGHEAFSAMRARGADVTDIVVLVVAGDEGIRAQTVEAIQHAKAAGVTIVVAANKCDKPNFDFEKLQRQLADNELLPETWGGNTIVVKCSAVSGEGITELLEMLALQAEVLELKASPKARGRGMVLESELHKGLGMVANIIVMNGTLKNGDALVFEESFGRIKTMYDEHRKILNEAGPSTPLEITGLSGLPEAGEEFIVVASEQEARKIAEMRQQGKRLTSLQQKKALGMESFLQQAKGEEKKVLKIILRADVQGSLEALKNSIQKIESDKAQVEVVFAGIGEITESDVQLAAASNAVILGFHVQIQSHAEPLLKQYKVHVNTFDIIYHAIDQVKAMMTDLLDKITTEVERGKAEVRQTFKSSQVGVIAGCIVSEGSIHRNHLIRLVRNGDVIWKGTISSLKRLKDDVREVQKGLECGIALQGNNEIETGDEIQSYEISYIAQKL